MISGRAIAAAVFLLAPSLPAQNSPEQKAVRFLAFEVPAWPRKNGCFSCHNNGDAARALYAAERAGLLEERQALETTTEWLSRPARWKENKGDPGFSDQALANIQFAAALGEAIAAGMLKSPEAVSTAAKLLISDQSEDGSWTIEPHNPPGSPATYGTALATSLAMKFLAGSGIPEALEAAGRARAWLLEIPLNHTPAAAAVLLGFAEPRTPREKRKREQAVQYLKRAQGSTGGWGPYPDSPAEAYDTALALLGLASTGPGTETAIRRGREYLVSGQQADGSWPPTTRPTGGASYAQRLSTTGWAALALVATSE